MKMQMPDGEIITCYRQAKDREEQIGILADRNLCKKSQMREYLITLGLDVPVKKRHKATGVPKKPPMDEIRAMELYREGQNDLGIAETLGESVNRVREWRYRMRLPAQRERKSKERKNSEVNEPMIKQLEETPVTDEIRTETLPEEPAIQNDEEEGTDCRGPAGLAMTEKEDEAPQRMGLRGLLRVLQNVEKAFPEAEVELYEEGTLAGVGVIVDYTADGTPGHTTVRLIGER